jgi:two-component system response regulator MprA
MPNKILIVDDEPFNLDVLEQELMEYEYIIERAVDGVDALAKTESFRPGLDLARLHDAENEWFAGRRAVASERKT